MELEVLTDKRSNIVEIVSIALSVSKIDLNSCLVSSIKEVFDKKHLFLLSRTRLTLEKRK